MDGQSRIGAPDVDVVIVGAGFGGMYMLHTLRKLGFTGPTADIVPDEEVIEGEEIQDGEVSPPENPTGN